MVKRSGVGDFGAGWLQEHGLPVGSEPTGLSSRVRRVAPGLPMQPEEPVVAGRGPTKTVTLAVLLCRISWYEYPSDASGACSCSSSPWIATTSPTVSAPRDTMPADKASIVPMPSPG